MIKERLFMSDRPGNESHQDNISQSPQMADAVSSLISKMDLHAEISSVAEYCGVWSVDTSGERRMPFHLVESGNAWLHIDEKAPIQLSAGDLVFFPSDKPHVISSQEKVASRLQEQKHTVNTEAAITALVCGYFEFRNKLSWPLLDTMNDFIILDLCDTCDARHVKPLLAMLCEEVHQREPGFCASITFIASQIFLHILRQQIKSGHIGVGYLKAMFDPRIGPVISAMHLSPASDWDLNKMASLANMGRSRFAEHFSAISGDTPIHYLTKWRMQEAETYLSNTSKSVTEIAELVGYDAEAAFRKAFKRITGITPGEFRKSKTVEVY